MTWRMRCLVGMLAAGVLDPSGARAESFVLTAGTAIVSEAGPGLRLTGSLAGEGISLLFRWDFPADVPCVTAPCDPGQAIALDAHLAESIIQVPPAENVAFGSATVRGETMTGIAFGGDLRFTGPEVTLPPLPPGDPEDFPVPVALGGPFRLDGTLRGYRVLGVMDPVLLFTADLFARGTAEATLLGSSDLRYRTFEVRYDLEPVPEPASLLLVGTGLLAAGAAARRRGRRQE